MNELDLYYRALVEYRKVTADNRDLERRRKTLASANADGDKIEIVKTNCIIDDDWIEAIEKGLVHVEKAINEERQFIRSNGEVVPIEKVKNVSKDSVEHLARHSNLLTKVTEGEDLIPDKLYTVERLSDYTVYENRFLYMLLCYLRDFIAFRYEKIVELTNTYSGKLSMVKSSYANGRKTELELKLNEEIKDDPYIKEHNPVKDKIERIDLIFKTVLAFLKTPLMEAVSKAPMIKPPITETNVLRMNKNFKGAKELYYFISSYTKAGYEIERIVEITNPLSETLADLYAEATSLTAFLTYAYGLGIENELKAAYEMEEQRRREEENAKKLEKLNSLRKRISQSGESPEEYLLLLEKRARALENDSNQLNFAKAEIDKLNGEAEDLKSEIGGLNQTIEQKEREAAEEAQNHAKQIEQLKAEHTDELEKLKAQFAEKAAKERAELITKVKLAEREKAEKAADCEKAKRELNKANEDLILLGARLNALRHEYKLFTAEDDFSSQESFNEIERQYEAFKKFFKSEWKTAKKKIRKEILTKENIKSKSEARKKDKARKADIDDEKE